MAIGRTPRNVFTIMYHDVIENGDYDSSGFPGLHAQLYKLDVSQFARHLDAISVAAPQRHTGLVLTFDDGGISIFHTIAPLLERNGWQGYFFVPTSYIGGSGFLDARKIQELDRRGHVIGSHSYSHPTRISHMSREHVLVEWSVSVRHLEDIVGHRVTVASVPGGFYSRKVAETAAEAGIEMLFTSEPTARVQVVEGCRILGRYTIQHWMGPEWSGGFAAGRWSPRLRQALSWKFKQAAKSMGGSMYVRAQQKLFSIRAR